MSTSIPTGTLEKFATFGDLLRFLRRRVGITQLDLASAVGYSDAQISRLEQNLRLPDLTTIESLFVPALALEDEPKVLARLLDLAANVRREDVPAFGVSPYKGLNYFDEADADLFAGREALTAKLTERILACASNWSADGRRFLAVVGASGSGKSSLVRAGLVPSLRWNKASSNWNIQVFTPTARPLESLAANLTESSAATASLVNELQRDSHGLQLFIERTFQQENAKLLLVVDQFEELFSLCHSEEERTSFIDNLLTAASGANGNAILILTLRADFYAYCAGYLELREALARQQEYIGAMNNNELRHAIEEPARRGRWELEPGLVDLLLHDVGHEPGALPLLSHALLETWKRRRGHTLTLSGYTSSGGVRGAIAETAEAVFADQFTPEQKLIAQRIFLRLTELGEETAAGDTRRRAAFDELTMKPEQADSTRAVLNALAEARLITLSENSAEVAHEALIREWPTLRGWLEDNRESIRLHRHLTETALEWSASNREPDLLYRGARLTQVREWVVLHSEDVNELERDFLSASVENLEKETTEKEASRQRELEAAQKLAAAEKARAEEQKHSVNRLKTRNRLITTVSAIAFVLALTAAAFGIRSNRNAELAEDNFTRAEAQRLAAEASILLKSNAVNSELVALLALRSLNLQYSPQGDAALMGAATLDYPAQIFTGHEQDINGMTFSPDGRYVLTAGLDHTARLWDVRTGQEIKKFDLENPVKLVAFSPDGRYVLTGDEQNRGAAFRVQVWDSQTGEKIHEVIPPASIYTAIFSPDGETAMLGCDDSTLRIWDWQTGQITRSLSIPTQQAEIIWGITPNGRYAISRSITGFTMSLWELSEPIQLIQEFTYSSNVSNLPGNQFAFSQDGNFVAFGDMYNLTYVLDTRTGKEIRAFNSGGAYAVAFSPDSSLLLTGSQDKTVRMWSLQSGGELYRFPQTEDVWSSTFSPDGKSILLGSMAGTARLWNIPLHPELPIFNPYSETVAGIAFSPDGKNLAVTSGFGNEVQIRNAGDGKILQTFPPAVVNYGVRFSPDGRYLLVGDFSGVASLWDVTSGEEVRKFVHPVGMDIYDVAFSPDGKKILTGGPEMDRKMPVAQLWSTETGDLIFNLALPAHDDPIFGVAFSPNGQMMLTAHGVPPKIKLWDANTGKLMMELSGHTGYVTRAQFSPDGKTIISASFDKTARLWDVKTGQEIRQFIGHSDGLWNVAFAPDGKTIATASTDGTARLWDVQTGKELRRFVGHIAPVENVIFSPDGKFIVTAGDDGMVRFWDVDYHVTLQYLCSRLLRDFTDAERAQYNITDNIPTCPKL